MEDIISDYNKYRGKCKEYVDKAIKADPSLVKVRGHYHCPMWGVQAHWWCVKPDGGIFDPTVKQFPKPHVGDYIPFNGKIECSQCGKQITEETALFHSNYAFCSTSCNMRFVGL